MEPYSEVNSFAVYHSNAKPYNPNERLSNQGSHLSSRLDQQPTNLINSVSFFQSANMNNPSESANFVYASSEHLSSSHSYYPCYESNTAIQYEQYNQPSMNPSYANNPVLQSSNWHFDFDNGNVSKTTNELDSNNSISFESVANIDFDLTDLAYI
jgi:hypothetical protein